VIIELENPTAVGPGDPQAMIVVAQNGTIVTKKVIDGQVSLYREQTPEGDFEEALGAHLTFLVAAGFKVVD
jgi:hypothetical protein